MTIFSCIQCCGIWTKTPGQFWLQQHQLFSSDTHATCRYQMSIFSVTKTSWRLILILIFAKVYKQQDYSTKSVSWFSNVYLAQHITISLAFYLFALIQSSFNNLLIFSVITILQQEIRLFKSHLRFRKQKRQQNLLLQNLMISYILYSIIQIIFTMEKQKQDDDKLLAIMQFIHHYDKGVSLTSLLNGTSFIKLIEHIPSYQYNFEIKLNLNASKWSQMLQNLQTIIYKIQEYFQSVHHKSLQTADVDLISLTKSQDLGQLIKYFEIVMTLLMESSCKQDFIQTIMVLQQTSQEIFVDIIKRSLDGCKFTKSKHEQNMFYRLINQFDQQRLAMEKQIQRLCKANLQLLSKIKQQQETISQIQLDLSTRKSGGELSNDDRTNTKYLQQYIDRLQIRIVQQSKAYEQQKLNSTQKINELQEKIAKLSETEQLNKIYKQKYDQIMDQMQKMNIWKKQKAKMEKMMEEKDFMVQKLHDRIEQLAQKNLNLEQSELQSKLQLQKRQIKLQKMSSQLKKVMENIGHNNSTLSNKVFQGSLLDQSLKQCVNLSNMKGNLQDSLFGTDDHANQTKKQNEKLLKKCKKQQKQICKLVKKVERLRFLQQDKNKLQQLVFQLRHTHSQQLNLMFAVFYQGFQQNLQISKKLRHQVLSYNEKPDEIVRKQKHSRKRTNSSIKGKQNWKDSGHN